MILETDRLALREITSDDLDFLAEMLADPEVARFYPKALTRDETLAWMEMNARRYAEYGHGVWLVLDRHAGHPVGRCGLTIQQVDGVPEPEIVVPDLIMILELDTGAPITTESLRFGQRVAVIGLPAHDLLKTPEALKVVGPKAFGYPDLTFRPMAVRKKAA